MSWGIMDLLGSAVTFVFVTPLALAGVELLLRGNLVIGAALLGVAVAMVLVDQFITTPGDLPAMIASKLAGAVARPPDEE